MSTKKLILTGIVTTMSIGAMVLTPVKATESTTSVTYNNQNIVGESGVWGVIIPTAVTFADGATTETGDISVELAGVQGYALADLNEKLIIKVSAKSTNGYKLKMGANEASYSVTYGELAADVPASIAVQAEQILNTGTTAVEIAKLTKNTPKRIGTASLGVKPTVKGTYSDTITFSMEADLNGAASELQ